MQQIPLNYLATAITLAIVLIFGGISIMYLGDYGLSVFILAPFLIGFLPNIIARRKKEPDFWPCVHLGMWTLFFACLSMLVFAFEGLICILMASPILIGLTFLGATFAYFYLRYRFDKLPSNNQLYLLFAFLSIGFLSFDTLQKIQTPIPATTTIVVNAPIEKVWENVVSFSTIPAPTEWLFKTGIAYPMDATIVGSGIGAVRYCNFTTGSFVEPITTWNAPHLLQFDVKDQPVPMHEWNPFWEVHPPHLNGYFKSSKGEFRLTALDAQTTQLSGTTWYTVDIHPLSYWKLWSSFIVHEIHERVLTHIKEEAERL